MSLDRLGRDTRFRLLHNAFRLTLPPSPSALVASGRSRVRFELYQQIPALRILALPRPRRLNASNVRLGKMIASGIALQELIARRRGGRILIICPAGIADQWAMVWGSSDKSFQLRPLTRREACRSGIPKSRFVDSLECREVKD